MLCIQAARCERSGKIGYFESNENRTIVLD